MNHLYPLKVSYVTKSPLWGGTRLIDHWGIAAPCEHATVGEAWMLTVRDKEMSVIQNGDLAGMTMRRYIDTYGNEVVGSVFSGGDFPLLIKLIDACDRLSVQVHPNDEYAARVEHDRGKTEMWVIIEAAPDAEIIYGLKDGMTAEQFRQAVRDGHLSDTMHHCPVQAGDVFFIPAGMLHAIGKGILIAEIQQNCDLTYRVYDYDRRGADGSLRELHVDKALDVTVPFTEEEVNAIRYESATEQDVDVLAHCRYFKARKLTAPKHLCVDTTSFVYLLCVQGNGNVVAGDNAVPVQKGEGVYLPAGLGKVDLDGDFTVLTASLQ